MDKPFHLADRPAVAQAIEAAAACNTLDELYAAIAAYRGTEASHTVPFARPSPTAIANPLMFVAERPEEADHETGHPYSGKDAGGIMREVMKRFNIDMDDVHVTYACHYPPSYEETPNATTVSASRPFLFRELEIVKPRAILVQGRIVLDSLFGIREKLTPLVGCTLMWRRGDFSTQGMVANNPSFPARFKASVPDFEFKFMEFLERFGMPDGKAFDRKTHDLWWREAA